MMGQIIALNGRVMKRGWEISAKQMAIEMGTSLEETAGLPSGNLT